MIYEATILSDCALYILTSSLPCMAQFLPCDLNRRHFFFLYDYFDNLKSLMIRMILMILNN